MRSCRFLSIATVVFILAAPALPARELHVAKTGRAQASGSADDPLNTINAAAQLALPGDTVTVHEGVYREWIDPLRGGIDDSRRIVYRAAEGETVEIKGSEVVTGWKKAGKDLWSVSVPNAIFGSFNPFAEVYFGDWLMPNFPMHLGDVYFDDVSLYEVPSPDNLLKETNTYRDPDGVRLNWYATVGEESTTITACFGGADPNKHTVEISVRPTCFYPSREGLNYITIKGFRISQAATRWAAPTAEQIGMVAIHWSKGWIIEDNIIIKDPAFKLEEVDGAVKLTINLPALPADRRIVDTGRLGVTYLTGYHYENFDGSPIRIDKDYFGKVRSESGAIPGPFAELSNDGYIVWVPNLIK